MQLNKTLIQYPQQQIDQYLRTLISDCEDNDWVKIVKDMEIKFPCKRWSVEECKERWNDITDQYVSKHPWTEQEEIEMLIGYRKYRNKWSSISQALNKRDNNTIKNRFYSILRKIINKIKHRDLVCNSRLELLECLYMLSLIEQCYQNPLTPSESRKKRGKNYLYSLLKFVKLEDINKYKEDLRKVEGQESSLEELWEELDKKSPSVKTKRTIPKEVPLLLSDLNTCDKSKRILPLPNIQNHPTKLTNEEKTFVFIQVFQKTIPSSAKVSHSTIFDLSLSCLRSAGRIAPRTQYEGFSEFTKLDSHVQN